MARTPPAWCVVLIACLTALIVGGGCTKQPGASPTAAPPPSEGSAPEAQGAGPAVDGDWLLSRLSNEPAHLNPLTYSDAYAAALVDLMFDTMLDRDNETLEIIPKLAEKWEVSEDHLEYTFMLRKDAVFSDGTPLTAHDVKFTFEKLMDPATDAARLRNYYQDITSCEVVDDHAVRFTCAKPYFKHLTMLGGLSVIPRHIYGEGDFNSHPRNREPLGSGPYVFESWETGLQISLVRNERYWGDKPHILKRVYTIITNANAAFQVLERQELDTMGLTPEQWVNQAAGPEFEAKFNKFQYYAAFYNYVGWNQRLPQFEDKRVRRALTMLLERETILETILYGLGEVVTGNFFIHAPEYDATITPWPFDPAQAKRLLDEAGWVDGDGDGIRDKDGAPFQFELLIRAASPEYEAIATVFQEELKRAGIGMSIRPLEWATFLESVDGRTYDAVILGWSGPIIEGDPYQVWHSSQAQKGSNFVGFRDQEADGIMEKARLEFDQEKRNGLYHRFHAILHEEQPYTFLFCTASLQTVDKRFRGIRVYRAGLDSREWWAPADLQRYP